MKNQIAIRETIIILNYATESNQLNFFKYCKRLKLKEKERF